MNVLSLFGGIECGRVALDRLGIPVDKYFSSEIDPYAIKITMENYPDIIHVGSVKHISYRRNMIMKGGRLQYHDSHGDITEKEATIDIIIGGSPCQDLSTAKANGKGLEGEKSGLFYEYVRILNEVKPKYFLLENVASMKKADREKITEILGVEPILINSSLVSAQNRKRLYWTNIPGVTIPKNKGIILSDILEEIPLSEWNLLEGKHLTDSVKKAINPENYFTFGQFRRTTLRIHSEQSKICTLTANMGTGGNNVPIILGLAHRNRGEGKLPESNGIEKANSLTTVNSDSEILAYNGDYYWRKLTPLECERLQTLPDNYTNHVSNSRRYKAIGNGWTVDVIAHIFSYLQK